MAGAPQYKSDRWITPGVIIAGILTLGLVVAVVAVSVAYLTARGIDPQPMLQLVAGCATGVGTLGTLVLQLSGRSTQTKVERNTGVLASVIADVIPSPAPAPAPRPAPAPAPAVQPAQLAGRYVVDLEDDPADQYDDQAQTAAAYRPPLPVPPLPEFPRHRRSTTP